MKGSAVRIRASASLIRAPLASSAGRCHRCVKTCVKLNRRACRPEPAREWKQTLGMPPVGAAARVARPSGAPSGRRIASTGHNRLPQRNHPRARPASGAPDRRAAGDPVEDALIDGVLWDQHCWSLLSAGKEKTSIRPAPPRGVAPSTAHGPAPADGAEPAFGGDEAAEDALEVRPEFRLDKPFR